MILDSTCGTRIMWRVKELPQVVYLDVRPEVKPTIVGDAGCAPFRDEVFDIIYFDPPYGGWRWSTWTYKKFGMQALSRYWYGPDMSDREIITFILRCNREFKRLLKPGGLIFFKWCDTSMPLSKVLPLLNNFLVARLDHIKSPLQRGKSHTYWVTLTQRWSTPRSTRA